jgi:hypothetical protein
VKTAEQIGREVIEANYGIGSPWEEPNAYGEEGFTRAQAESDIGADEIRGLIVAAIEADRAQRFNAADMEVLFEVAESGIAREVAAIDVRHQYANGEIERMKRRWSGARAAIAALREVLA